jgi:hypothetical protein
LQIISCCYSGVLALSVLFLSSPDDFTNVGPLVLRIDRAWVGERGSSNASGVDRPTNESGGESGKVDEDQDRGEEHDREREWDCGHDDRKRTAGHSLLDAGVGVADYEL